ncbi:MAG: TrbC/VirB2 family protein [Nanoarchaeota archaeon]
MRILINTILAFLILSGIAYSLTDSQKQDFDTILTPLLTIYDLLRYSATIIASIFLVFSGISYMTSSNDPKKKDVIKSRVGYIVIGLVIIWAAPYLVGLVLK